MVGSGTRAGEGRTTTGNVRAKRSLQRRRIIERPRLFTLLDDSPARVRTLIAPAGYGKTTLARQWVARDGRRFVWYTVRRASADAAGLALGLARAASDLVDSCDERLREHLRAVPNSSTHVEVLAEILSEDLAAWPADAWIVLDEYQELVGAREAERFLAELVSACPVQVLIASRQRPSWVTARRILYDEVLELNQFALAMDAHEAAEVLGESSAQSASGLVALANGWPAVIGLASVSAAEIEGDDEVPESLYRFFAEEVFDALGDEIRDGLAMLAIAPVLDRELAGKLLGGERFESVSAPAQDVGILEERDAELVLHPLARSFLDERAGRERGIDARLVDVCLDHYMARRDWDAAFDLISRRGPIERLEGLLLAALDDLLTAARLPTIESWCAAASKPGVSRAVFSLARAEVALRNGRHAEAQAFGEAAARESHVDGRVAFRALCAAGRAAHLASREQDGVQLYHRAAEVAGHESELREALWGQLNCAIELELPEATGMLAELRSGASMADPTDYVRSVGCTTTYQLKMGQLDIAEADVAWELVPTISDPLLEAGYHSIYANALALVGRYEDALEIAGALLATARRYRFDFAAPYAHCTAAMAHAGLRDWRAAELCLDQATDAARARRDSFVEQLVCAIRLRLLAQQGRLSEALALPLPQLSSALRSTRAEVLSSRALALSTADRLDEALGLVEEVRGTTHAIEVTVLIAAVEAIVAIKRGEPSAIESVIQLECEAFRTGAVDILVTAYRSTPELLTVLLGRMDTERLVGLVRRAHDEDIAAASGRPVGAGDALSRLSVRERDVYKFLRDGLTNRQIAEMLFLSESTVKVHVHHIYDKLGVRSRTAIAVRAALERSDQATSATRDSGDSS